MHAVNRSDRPGGGLALIRRSKYPCKEKQRGSTPSFEYAVWELNIKNELLTIHGVYHPHYSPINRITNVMFINNFVDYVSTAMPVYRNNLFIGDF